MLLRQNAQEPYIQICETGQYLRIQDSLMMLAIDTAIKRMTSSLIWLFWIVWILVTGGAVYGFYYLDNDWLNT